MFESEKIERNRVIAVTSEFDLDLVSQVRKVKVELIRDIDLASVPTMFGSEQIEGN